MKLRVAFGLRAFAQKPDERAKVNELNREYGRVVRSAGGVTLDESHAADLVRILSDMRQLFDRSRATRKRRPK